MLVQQATQFFFHSFLNVKKNEQNHFHKSISIKWYFFIFERKTSAYFMFVATQPHNRSEAKQCKKKTCKNANVSLSNRICNRPFDTRQFQLIGVFLLLCLNFCCKLNFFDVVVIDVVTAVVANAYNGDSCEEHGTCIISITVMALPSNMRIIHVKWHTMYTIFFLLLFFIRMYTSLAYKIQAHHCNRCAMNSVFEFSIYCQSINLTIHIFIYIQL